MSPFSPFTAPFTFPNTSYLPTQASEGLETHSVVESSLLAARPTVLEYWGGADDNDDCGVILGCEDGTLYVLQKHPHIAAPVEVPSNEARKWRPKSPAPLTRPTHGSSHPSTPTSPSFVLSPTLNVPTRARVVAGVTTEQVEAPKYHIDFDDEPDKLKDILKGRNPRERHIPSEASSLFATSSPPSIIEPAPVSRKKASPRSLLSATNSPVQTPRSFSTPDSPTEQPPETAFIFSLRYHIIPRCSGSDHSVRAIQMLADDKLVAVLHEPGDLNIYSSKDGTCVTSVSAADRSNNKTDQQIWNWCSLKVATIDESTIIFVTAATDVNTSAPTPDVEESSSEKSQTVVFILSVGPNDVKLERLDQWELDGPARGIGIHRESDESSSFFSINTEGHFLVRRLQLQPPTPAPSAPMALTPESDHLGHLALPKGLKAMISQSSENLNINVNPPNTLPKVILHENHDVGDLLSDSTLSGLCTRDVDGRMYGIVWAHREMTIFEYHAQSLRILTRTSVLHLEDVEWLDDTTYVLSYDDRMEIYKLKPVNADNDPVGKETAEDESTCHHSELIRILPTGQHDASTFIPSSDLILTKISEDGCRQLISFHARPEAHRPGPAQVSSILWQSNPPPRCPREIVQTASLPLEIGAIVQGYSDGCLRQYSLEQMTRKDGSSPVLTSTALKTSEPPLPGYIVGLHSVQNPRTREKFIIGGADDGSVAFWRMSTFELCARWILFSTSLVKVVEFEQEKVSPLHGCVLCIAQDGTVAVIAIDGFQLLYMVPGSAAPLKQISLGGPNLLLIYGGQFSRIWDVQTKEFWRSMSLEKARDMLAQGGWTTINLKDDVCLPRSEWGLVAPAFAGRDSAATLTFSLEKFIIDSIALTKTISTSRNEIRDILRTLDRLRLLLSVVLTPGLSDDVDSICSGKLKLKPSSVGVGLSSLNTTTVYPTSRPQDIWCISGNVSAARMLEIVFILRAMSLFEELLGAANTVISFYTTSLGACVGPNYVPPSLEYLGRKWFAASSELRQAIRIVFDATLARLSDQEAISVAEKWQHYVPSLQPDAERETVTAALALLIGGSIAAEKFTLLSVNALTDISKSITIYLHDEDSSYRVLAIDLCSRGFHVWQHYVDTMEILRSLFNLATNSRKDSISIQNVGAQARLSVLAIAAQNTALFVSTLCLDVLNPPTLDHRRSVMQIFAFLIRKRPYILQPHLARLMEAVVKSLDPNSNADREAVLDTATEIIGYVVKTFPTVDFHMPSQRLAVGTNEGAVVMYDLKTAMRLYVIEGHKRHLTACSFSPDGRRLVSLSLAEQMVLVWKVGSSFSSFFHPGAPPRQGHGGSQPFKTLSFNIGNECDMTLAETLELVKFEWVADRSVKVKIRDSILTFST